MTRILAIETSCDETAAAVVRDGRCILSNVVASQVELHARYGGIFPEIASRAHIEAIVPVIERAMQGFDDLDAVAVTYGPGLAGSLLVGVNAAKGLALGRNLPLVGVNHLEAHIYAHWLEVESEGAASPLPLAGVGGGEGSPPASGGGTFPLLALIVSGGHTELALMHDHGQYEYLGGTLDDAAGEAFDKVGRLLGLSYPGGPAIQEAARGGNPRAFRFPRAWLDSDSYDFSFSGLKTAAKAVRAAEEFGVTAVLLCGGVSANQSLRATTAERAGVPVCYTPPIFCTDNAAMVGACAYQRFVTGERAGWDLDVVPSLRLV